MDQGQNHHLKMKLGHNLSTNILENNVKDYPMTNEQISKAEYSLDKQRLRDDGKFRECQAPSLQSLQSLQSSQNPWTLRTNSMHHTQTPQGTQGTQGEGFYPWCEPPLPEFLDPSKSINLKMIKNTKKDTRCYTCKPRGDVKKHIICESISKAYVFHHDMHRRPIIMVSPKKHVSSVDEMSPDELVDMFKSIKDFTTDWNISDYHVSCNYGKWQTSDHFHCKIKICDKIILRMRRDHFSRIKLCDRYTET